MEDKNQTTTNLTPLDGAIPPVVDLGDKADVQTTTPTVSDSITTPDTPPSSNKRTDVIKQYGIATAVILLIGTGLWYALEQQGRVDTKVFASLTQLVTPVPVAAVVNGVKIPLADYEKNKLQLEQAATQNGNDPKNPSIAEQIKTQALDVLVNTELLRQEASKAGLSVTTEQVDARYAEIVTGLQGEDKLIARMAELGMTKDGLRKDIEGEILIQSYLTKEIDVSSISINEKEIQAVYDQAKANATPESPLPPLEQVKSDIESQLRTTKEQEIVNAFIEKLRSSATIETKI